MDIQELFLRSYEFFSKEDTRPITDEEHHFVLNQLTLLNQRESLSEREKKEAEALFGILIYFKRDSSIDSLKLNKTMKEQFDSICGE